MKRMVLQVVLWFLFIFILRIFLLLLGMKVTQRCPSGVIRASSSICWAFLCCEVAADSPKCVFKCRNITSLRFTADKFSLSYCTDCRWSRVDYQFEILFWPHMYLTSTALPACLQLLLHHWFTLQGLIAALWRWFLPMTFPHPVQYDLFILCLHF